MTSQLRYPNWLRAMTKGNEHLFRSDEPISVGCSGGKTSALLTYLVDEHNNQSRDGVYYGFQNTGEEHSQTYLFLQRVSASGLPVQWNEFRKPATYGAPPKESRYAVVTPETASRNGEPFEWMLETLAEYRQVHKNLEPISGGPAMRLCSAYLKSKVAEKVVADFGWEQYTTFIGFRADELDRFKRIKARETADKSFDAPLAHLGITTEHVKRFWREQPFTLNCPENLGNCNLCFLKDQGDLAHNMAYDVLPEVTQRWIHRQKLFGRFDASKDYAELLWEAPIREAIREGLAGGLLPVVPSGISQRRFDLLVRQERRRTVDGIQRWQCNCEAAELLDDAQVLEAVA